MNLFYNIEESFNELKSKLDTLYHEKPLQSKSRTNNEYGYFIEEYLGIKKNELPIADYCGIEIKCINNKSKYPIKLFSSEFDGDGIFLSKELFNKYAIETENQRKAFCHIFSTDKYTYLNDRLFGKLRVDYKKNIVVLEITFRGRVIESKYYWTFNSLYNRIQNKLSYMSIVEYNSKYENGHKYYSLNKYSFYKLRSCHDFINMLATGKIGVSCSMSSLIDENNNEKLHNRGFSFFIKKEYLNILFIKI